MQPIEFGCACAELCLRSSCVLPCGLCFVQAPTDEFVWQQLLRYLLHHSNPNVAQQPSGSSCSIGRVCSCYCNDC
jgi:hypothetical protein